MEVLTGLHASSPQIRTNEVTGGTNTLMNTLFKFALAVVAGILPYSTPMAAQFVPTSTKAARVRITQGPELEMSKYDMAIIRWTSDNPGGSPEHYGVVHYGTNPRDLSETAKSYIRLNPTHSYTVF